MQIDEVRAKHAVQQSFQKIVKPADFDAAKVENLDDRRLRKGNVVGRRTK